MHADADRSGSSADDLTDLVVGQLGAVPQCEQVLLLWLQLADEPVQPFDSLEREQSFFRPGIRVGDERGLIRERLLRRPALCIEHRVPSDLEQPAREAALPVEATDLRQRRGEDVARHVSQVTTSPIRTRA